jgi:hypothetical protein
MKPCLKCEELTTSECVCGHAFCQGCRELLRAALCPMCVRIAAIQREQALSRRLVPWQVVENTALFLSVGQRIDLGARTEPMETMKVDVA